MTERGVTESVVEQAALAWLEAIGWRLAHGSDIAPDMPRWTSYGINALGQASGLVTPHALYRALGATDDERLSVYRALFRAQLDKAAIDEIRLALNQSQPLGEARFYARIERMTGQRREPKPRGRPRVLKGDNPAASKGQGELGL